MTFIRNVLIRVRGGEPLPEGVAFDLERGERILTWGRIAGGGIAAATDFALRVRPGDNAPARAHLWHEVARAAWGDGQLTVDDLAGTTACYRLTEPRGVPAAVREHVDATVVVTERHSVGDRTVRVLARRDLRNGRLVWSTFTERDERDELGGRDEPDDPQFREQAASLLAQVRRRYGG